MKKKKMITVFIGTCLLALLIFGSFKLMEYQAYGQYVYFVPERVMKDYAFFNDRHALVIDWEYENEVETAKQLTVESTRSLWEDGWSPVGEDYALNMHLKLTEDPTKSTFNRNTSKKGEYWEMTVYDLSGETVTSKTYDIFELARKNRKVPLFYSAYHEIWKMNGKEYLPFMFKDFDGEVDRYLSFIDLSTGKIDYSVKQKDIEDYLKTSYTNNLAEATSLKDYFYGILDLDGQSDGTLTADGVKASKDWQLQLDSKKALNLLQNGHSRFHILSIKTDVSIATSTWQLLLPEGKDLFDHLTIYSDYSVDGQEHTVNSMEEFKKYYKTKLTE